MPADRVLDAWALLTWVQRSLPSAVIRVRNILERGARGDLRLRISLITLGEVYYNIAKKKDRIEAEAFLEDFRSMPIQAVGVSRHLVLNAARLKARYPISYADAFALATARQEGAALVTGDPDLARFRGGEEFRIDWIGA